MVTKYEAILQLMRDFDPRSYAATRNYQSGSVSRLSPYISRGVISTRMVYENLKECFKDIRPFEKFVQELAWRDYWQRVWQATDINEDVKRPQENISHFDMPQAVIEAKTGIEAVDDAIHELYGTGYMHNHMRMYVASIVCNVGQAYWKEGARWMYAHLLDADWGSNALSWQWVAGSNSSKKYYANQENINKYFDSNQRGTFLDQTYDQLMNMPVPEVLKPESKLELQTPLPQTNAVFDPTLPTLVFTHYNLDPKWHHDMEANRVLLMEPKHFEAYPMSAKTIDFILELSKNIEGIQVFTGSFDELRAEVNDAIYFKEHPFSAHFVGIRESRDWLNVEVPRENSFFRYWKELRKTLPEFA
ncbi:MAG: deoxyribodipyrimidine photolyase [bacterium]|nr:deoxyribodipyrimidine photolyase [bacterium]